MKICLFTLTGLLAILCQTSEAGVGRVGNSSIGSSTEKFVTPLPHQFPLASEAFHKIFLNSPIKGPRISKQGIVGETLANVFGNTRSWSRLKWVEEFANSSDRKRIIKANHHQCIFAIMLTGKAGQLTGLAAFGKGRGVVFSTPSNVLSERAVERMLEDIRLTDGDCQW